jgi:hypothetical protein
MNTPAAIVIAGSIIGASIIGATVADSFLGDRYELATTGGDTALGWLLNKRTGAVAICELAKRPRPAGADPYADLHLPLRAVDLIIVECGHD